MAKKHTGESLAEAEIHLKRAREQLDKAQVDAWEPSDPESCASNSFYAYENAVVAAAIVVLGSWEESHADKVKLAKRLYEEKHLPADISDLLDCLNDVRKDVAYGEPGLALRALDLEGLVTELDTYLDEVEKLFDKKSGE